MNALLSLNRALLKSEERPFYVGLVVMDPLRQKIMLGRRREDKKFTGPGGGANPGETPTQAIIREAFEESGLMLRPEDLQELPSLQTHDGKVCHCYLTFVDSENCHPHNNNDPDRELTAKGWRWFDALGPLPGSMGPHRLTTLNNALMKVYGLTKADIDDLEALLSQELLEKGRPSLPIGTQREWGGQKYVKHADGWVALAGPHHGKMMGKFKAEPSHKEFADQHHNKPAAEEPKPTAAPKEETPPKAESPKPEAPKAAPKPAPAESGAAKPKAAGDVRKELIKKVNVVEGEGGTFEVAIEGGTRTAHFTSRESADAHAKRLQGHMELEANAHNLKADEFARQYNALTGSGSKLGPKLKKMLIIKHKALTMSAEKEGYAISENAASSHAQLKGLPPELNDASQKKTNLIKSVSMDKVPKKRQPEFTKLLKDCNSVVAQMNVTFKKSIMFRADGSLKEGEAKRTYATYEGGGGDERWIALKDVSRAQTSIMHEIGHGVDYALAESQSSSVTRSAEMYNDPSEIGKKFREMMDLVQNSEQYQAHRGTSHGRYLTKPTEVFARAFEVYSLGKANKLIEEGKLDKSFLDKYLPDIFKDPTSPERMKISEQMRANQTVTDGWLKDIGKIRDRYQQEAETKITAETQEDKRQPLSTAKAFYVAIKVQEDQQVIAIQKEIAENRKKYSALHAQYSDTGSFTVSPEKQKEYISKITECMDHILKHDPIKKATALDLQALFEALDKTN